MAIEIREMNNLGIIVMSGIFDFNAHLDFKNAYQHLLENAVIREIEIDLHKVDFMDSSALGMLMLLNERAKAAYKTVKLVKAEGTVLKLLEITKFRKVFDFGEA